NDIFTLTFKRVEELTNEIVKYGVYYRCFGHSRKMTEQMASILSNSGCIETGFGAESGSQKILDTVGKRTTVEDNKRYIVICNKLGIRVKAFLMIGLPGENMETVKKTEGFIEFLLSKSFRNRFGKMITNDFDLGIYFPYKGTHIRDSIDMNKKEYDLFFMNNPDAHQGFYKGRKGKAEGTVATSKISCHEIADIQKGLLSKYKRYVIN
ncbi:MAG: radical SAM protein, partial [Candidatus Omnitrophota bacterium]